MKEVKETPGVTHRHRHMQTEELVSPHPTAKNTEMKQTHTKSRLTGESVHVYTLSGEADAHVPVEQMVEGLFGRVKQEIRESSFNIWFKKNE